MPECLVNQRRQYAFEASFALSRIADHKLAPARGGGCVGKWASNLNRLGEDILVRVQMIRGAHRLRRAIRSGEEIVVDELRTEEMWTLGERYPHFLGNALRAARFLRHLGQHRAHGVGLQRFAIDREHQCHRLSSGPSMPGQHGSEYVLGIEVNAAGHLGGLHVATQNARPQIEKSGLGERVGTDCARSYFFSGGKVLLHQDRRNREDIADVVESVAGVICGELVVRHRNEPPGDPARYWRTRRGSGDRP